MKIFYTDSYKTIKDGKSTASDEFLHRSLCAYVGDDAVVVRSQSGQPMLANYSDTYISITHTANYWLCAISKHETGIDAELFSRRVNNCLKLAERFFSERETAFLKSIEDDKIRNKAFIRMWTMKESYFKLTGAGIFKGMKGIQLVEDGVLACENENVLFREVTLESHENLCITVCTKKLSAGNHEEIIQLSKLE